MWQPDRRQFLAAMRRGCMMVGGVCGLPLEKGSHVSTGALVVGSGQAGLLQRVRAGSFLGMQTFSNIISRSAWSDRFTVPTVASVVAAIPSPLRVVVEYARAQLHARDLVEEFIWQGVWRWSFVYTHPDQPHAATAFIIPDPQSPRICIPLRAGSIFRLVARPLAGYIRDPIAAAQTIDGTRWPSWRIETVEQVDDLAQLFL